MALIARNSESIIYRTIVNVSVADEDLPLAFVAVMTSVYRPGLSFFLRLKRPSK